MASIAELFAMGQQRRMQREQFEQDQEMRQFQLDQLIQDRALDKRRTSPGYASDYLTAIDPDVDEKSRVAAMSRLAPGDLPNAVKTFQDNRADREKRLADMMTAAQTIPLAITAGRPELAPMLEKAGPLPATQYGQALTAGAATKRTETTQENINRRFQAGQVLKTEELGLKKLRAQTDAALAGIRGKVADATIRNLDARTRAANIRIATGDANLDDVRSILGALVVGGGGALDEDESALINQAATEAWEIAVFDGKPLSDSMNEMILKYEIGKKSPTKKGEAALDESRKTPSGRGTTNPVGAVFSPLGEAKVKPPETGAPAGPESRILGAFEQFGEDGFTTEDVLKSAGLENTLEMRNLVRSLYKSRGKNAASR